MHPRNCDLEHAATDGNDNILVRSNLPEHAAAIRWMENIMVVWRERRSTSALALLYVFASDGMADLGEKDKGRRGKRRKDYESFGEVWNEKDGDECRVIVKYAVYK